MCPAWLGGHCGEDSCPLQHALVPELMPACTFFLQVPPSLQPRSRAPGCSTQAWQAPLLSMLQYVLVYESAGQWARVRVQGACSKAECPYLHVNLEPAAPVCEAFLRGYCAAGASCRAKHLTERMLRDSRPKRSLLTGAQAAAPSQPRACTQPLQCFTV